MKQQERRVANIIRPYYSEEEAKKMVESRKRFSFKKPVEWISAIPLYIPFILYQVELDLILGRNREMVQSRYTAMINGLTNRGMMVSGDLIFDNLEQRGIYFDVEVSEEKTREAARLEILFNTKKLINPPPHRVLDGSTVVYYPLGLVHTRSKQEDEVRVFDYYRGGLDSFMMKYLRLREKMDKDRWSDYSILKTNG